VLEVLRAEARHAGADVGGGGGGPRRPRAGEQPTREHAVGGHAHAQLPAGGQGLRLDPARQQRVLDLQVGHWMGGMRAPERLGSCLRQADVAHPAGVDHLRDRSDRVLDRDGRVHATEAVDVDVIGAQALQGVGQEVPYRHRPSVDADEGVVRGAQRAELDAEHHTVAVPAPQVPDIPMQPRPIAATCGPVDPSRRLRKRTLLAPRAPAKS
jgi:hypothetical protein